ncbi:MFS transporter [Streptomyces sp. NPDC002845]
MLDSAAPDPGGAARPPNTLLFTLLFASTLGVLGGAIVAPVLEVIRSDLGISGTQAGLIITTHGLAMAVLGPLVGRAFDRWGVRGPLTGGLLLYALGGGAGLVTTSFPALIASRFLFGIGAGAVFTGTTVALLSYCQGPLRDQVMGWRTTATTVGGFIWPLLAGALGGFSWHTPFAIYLIGIPLGIAVLRVLPKTSTVPQGRSNRGAVRMLRTNVPLLGFLGLCVATGLMTTVFAVFLPQRLAQIGIEAPLLVAVYSVITSSVTATLVGMSYARARKSLSYGALIRIAVSMWATGLVLFGTVNHPALLLLVPALTGIGSGIALPTLTVLIDSTVPVGHRGLASSLMATAMFGGQFVSPFLFGPLMSATSITAGSLVASGLAVVTLAALFAAKMPDPEPDRDERLQPSETTDSR